MGISPTLFCLLFLMFCLYIIYKVYPKKASQKYSFASIRTPQSTFQRAKLLIFFYLDKRFDKKITKKMHIFKNTTKYMLYNIFLGYVISTLQILNKKRGAQTPLITNSDKRINNRLV